VCIALEEKGDICTRSGHCFNAPLIIFNLIIAVAVVLIVIAARAARAKKLAAARLSLTNQDISMQPTNIDRDVTVPESTNQTPSGLVTPVE
jgi:hypothetical protein